MPVPKHKPTTLSPGSSTPEASSPVVPEQEEFRQYLRRLAVSAVQVLIEQIMREDPLKNVLNVGLRVEKRK